MRECNLEDRKKAVHAIVSKVLNGSVKDETAYNTIHKKHLQENIAQYSFCVGAGISADIHMMISEKKYLWNELVYGIADEVFKWRLMREETINACFKPDSSIKSETRKTKILSEILKKLSENGDFLGTEDTMECVEYLKHLLFDTSNNPNDFESVDTLNENAIALIIYDLFYSKLSQDTGKRDITGELIKRIAQLKDKSKPKTKSDVETGEGKTIIELTKLIGRTVASKKRNVKVLTYNYDDYLEMTMCHVLDSPPNVCVIFDTETQRTPKSYECKVCKENQGKSEHHSVSEGDMVDNKPSVSVYHVHGYVPHYWDRMKMYGELVFSENSYSHMADEIYNWTNRIQAEVFSSDRVLFVGFSGVDANFRHLMRELHKEWHRVNGASSHYHDNRHTMFMGYDDIIKNVCTQNFYERELAESTMDRIAAQIILHTISAKDEYYRKKLGIELIWYYQHEEISDVLSAINNA